MPGSNPEHPPDPSLATTPKEKEDTLREWQGLLSLPPKELAALYKGSDDFELIQSIVQGGLWQAT